MPIHIVSHDACLLHDNGPDHPERPDRLRTLQALFKDPNLGVELEHHEAPEATRAQIERLHPPAHFEHVRDTARAGGGRLDPDTSVIEASWEAGLRAAGAGIRAVHLAFSTGDPVFAAVRPPGHHAEAAQAMGFCLFGNIALAAVEAREQGLAERVLIIDWDVHHGNGTQSLVEHEPAIRFISLHQSPLYPGTGAEDERGVGNVWNVPRAPGLPPED
ncbi:MAG: histone deacetylase, partial [Acidobacteriota bacterium]